MRAPLSLIPLLPVATGIICGILLGWNHMAISWITAFAIIAIMLMATRKTRVAIFFISIVIGYTDSILQSVPTADELRISPEQEPYAGIITDIKPTESGTQLTVSTADSCHTRFKALITVPTSLIDALPGDSIVFVAALKKPATDDAPDTFDYAAYLYNIEGVTMTAFVRRSQIDFSGRDENIYWRIRRHQAEITDILKRSHLDDATIEFLTATIIGDDSLLPEESRNIFSATGLSHILALSGLHAGIIMGMILAALFPLYLLRQRRLQLIVAITALWVYAIMTGLSPSVTRAAVMATTLSLGYILQRRYVAMNSLFLAAIIILLISPAQLRSIGFQMSFLAVGTIIVLVPLINNATPRHRITFYILSLILSSLAATAGTVALSAYYFHSLPVYFILANMPVLPLLPILMGGGVLLIILEACGLHAEWLCHILNTIYNLITEIANFVSHMPHSTLTNLYPTHYVIIFYYMALAMFAMALWHKRKAKWWITFCLFTITTVLAWNLSSAQNNKNEYFIARDTYHTSLVIAYNGNSWIYTTASQQNATTVLNDARKRYRDFIGRRNIDSLVAVADTMHCDIINYTRPRFVIGSTVWSFISADTMLHNRTLSNSTYAVVCRGFRGNVIDIARMLNPDTIVLSHDLHRRRHDRYRDSLILHKIPYLSVRINGTIRRQIKN